MSNLKTAVVAIARMEGRYLPEWIEHYQKLGFTNIILCDNNHDGDGEGVEAILKPYDGFVIYEPYRNKVGYQMKAYSEILAKYKNDYDWFFFCDIDEFLELPKHKDVSDFLSDKNDFDCVMVNWLCYGDNEQVLADYTKPLKERFPNPLPIDICVQYSFPENMHIKSFVKGGIDAVFGGNPHCCETNLKCCNASGIQVANRPWQPIDYANAYIKHYITKSTQEFFENKLKRGTGDRDYNSFLYTYRNRYFMYNQLTQEKLDWLKSKGYIK